MIAKGLIIMSKKLFLKYIHINTIKKIINPINSLEDKRVKDRESNENFIERFRILTTSIYKKKMNVNFF